ncbi:hypothetical protein ACLIKD_21100 [Azonexus sp. IMCC34842]|uniref:hypothetical protein n=1 Tax=Azonexus sp. IMCC34842 TaxID=3420950 RepID=UPI003D102A5C
MAVSLTLSAICFGQSNNLVNAYSPGQYEIDMRTTPAQITVRIPLETIEDQIRNAVLEGNSSSPDLTLKLNRGQFVNVMPGSPNLGLSIHVDGTLKNAGGESFQCKLDFDFAVPANPIFDATTQVLSTNSVCSFSGELAKLLGLERLLEGLLHDAVNMALNRTSGSDGKSGKELAALTKSDPRLANLLQRGRLQGQYCSSPRWPRALCLHISWQTLDFENYFFNLRAFAPQPSGISANPESAKQLAQQFSAAGALYPFGANFSFPTKRLADGQLDDGDALIFNGLLCLSGLPLGCETVKAAQDGGGRFWRSPHLVGSTAQNPFSGDQLKGAIGYFIAQGDAVNFSRFLQFLRSNMVLIPSPTNPIYQGYKSCTNDVSNTCLVGSSDWLWLTNIAEKLAVTSELPAATLDPEVRAWYTPDALVWEAAFTPLGYRTHLVGIAILFAQKIGLQGVQFKDAAAILASRQPHNPFFLYLHLGKDEIVANELAKKCDLNASQSAFDQWAWEREESESAWKTSMRWDCTFMYSLLSR